MVDTVDASLIQLTQTQEASPTVHETQIQEFIRDNGGEFLDTTMAVYKDIADGWRLCGPTSIALSRILSAKTGIPITDDPSEKERIELVIGIYDPVGEKRRTTYIGEETYIRYYTGDGSVYYIDPTYGVNIEGIKNTTNAIKIKRYSIDSIDQELQKKYHIYDLGYVFDHQEHRDALMKAQNFTQLFQRYSSSSQVQNALIAQRHILNTYRATMPTYLDPATNTPVLTTWANTEEIIRRFAPEWQPDTTRKTLEEARVHNPRTKAQLIKTLSKQFFPDLPDTIDFEK